MSDDKGAKAKLTLEVPFDAIEDRLTPVSDAHPARFETTGAFPNDDELRELAKTVR